MLPSLLCTMIVLTFDEAELFAYLNKKFKY